MPGPAVVAELEAEFELVSVLAAGAAPDPLELLQNTARFGADAALREPLRLGAARWVFATDAAGRRLQRAPHNENGAHRP